MWTQGTIGGVASSCRELMQLLADEEARDAPDAPHQTQDKSA
jgi:hypothetical protein